MGVRRSRSVMDDPEVAAEDRDEEEKVSMRQGGNEIRG
jgi:hypothetical protein